MVPIVELRGAIPIAEGLGINISLSYPISIIGNMLPVPIIYLFARKIKVKFNKICNSICTLDFFNYFMFLSQKILTNLS